MSMVFRQLILLALCLFASSPAMAEASAGFNRADSSALLAYAKGCLVARVEGRPSPPPPQFAASMQRPCFVTFFANGRVFACFGSFTPRRGNLAEELDEHVRMALKNDRRSRNLSREKAAAAGVQITFPAGELQRVKNYASIDPAREGMFVEGGGGAGVAFVPGETKTAAWAFREGLRRLGERDPASVSIYRFRAAFVSTRDR